MFQFIANDNMYKQNSKINGVSNTSVLCKIGKPEIKTKITMQIISVYI